MWTVPYNGDAMRWELHCHSTCSDGTEEPARVEERAGERGVAVFALTDHDTCAGSDLVVRGARTIDSALPSEVLRTPAKPGLAIDSAAAQFGALAATTLRHFDREQAIFTHHIAARSKRRKLPQSKTVTAPAVDRGKLVFRPFPLPAGFDMRDHDLRVEVFGRAFVTSVTSSQADYLIACDWVLAKFGKGRHATGMTSRHEDQ